VTLPPYELLVVAVVAAVVVVFLAFHFLHRYRLRRLKELRGEAGTPQAASDRAYNRLALARREADLLAAQGTDVEPARQLIALATRSLDGKSFDRAFELAQAAHETLVKARRAPLPSRPASPPPVVATAPATAPAGAPTVAKAGTPPAPAVPRNRAEAQFQLRLFEEELAAAAKGKRDRKQLDAARALYIEAHAAFARGEFGPAFRLALRGRRQIGGHVESLAPPPPNAAAAGAATDAPSADASGSAEQVAAQERCPLCGHPTVPGDAFCRGCGAPRTAPACPQCGAPRRPTDTFCGRCGERYG